MEAVRKHERQLQTVVRQEAGNVTALFGTLARAAEPPQPADKVLKERDALHSLFEQAPGFMALLEGPDHRYTFSNAANNRLMGRSDLVGKTVAEAFPELVEQGFVERLARVYATGEPYIGNGLPFEIRDTPDAEPRLRIINFIYQPIRTAPEAPITGIFIEGHDVTEQHEAHARIQAQNLSLVHVSRISAMGTMASTVAHELNQPLTAITNYLAAASRIAGRSEADPMLEGCLESAQDASIRAGNILRLLRDMTLSGVDLSPVFEVDDALQQTVELARASHPQLVVAYDTVAGASARVDRIQFQQVMLNLIRNAQEACGDRLCQLVIKVARAGPFLEVSLTDNGGGFAEDELPNVFEALVTSKPQGMGVGLSVCRTIIETYGGRISARNAPNGGATVTFTIPAG
jgi:two-component system, LuxR family, sensor kinase FixL